MTSWLPLRCRFAIVLAQHKLHRLPRILDAIDNNPGLLKALQDEVCRVAPYFTWEWNGAKGKALEATMELLAHRLRGTAKAQPTDSDVPRRLREIYVWAGLSKRHRRELKEILADA